MLVGLIPERGYLYNSLRVVQRLLVQVAYAWKYFVFSFLLQHSLMDVRLLRYLIRLPRTLWNEGERNSAELYQTLNLSALWLLNKMLLKVIFLRPTIIILNFIHGQTCQVVN